MVGAKELVGSVVVEEAGERRVRGSRRLARVVERVRARYEVQELPYGKVYVWRRGGAVLECGCGERLVCSGSAARCRCGADYEDAVRGLANPWPEGEERPWRAGQLGWREERADLPPEHHYRQELEAVE